MTGREVGNWPALCLCGGVFFARVPGRFGHADWKGVVGCCGEKVCCWKRRRGGGGRILFESWGMLLNRKGGGGILLVKGETHCLKEGIWMTRCLKRGEGRVCFNRGWYVGSRVGERVIARFWKFLFSSPPLLCVPIPHPLSFHSPNPPLPSPIFPFPPPPFLPFLASPPHSSHPPRPSSPHSSRSLMTVVLEESLRTRWRYIGLTNLINLAELPRICLFSFLTRYSG